MPEIDVTRLFSSDIDLSDFSASAMERGQNAGRETWGNACEYAAETSPLFITAELRDDFESWVREFGAWSREEVSAWTLEECNALFVQFVAGDIREAQSLCEWSPGEIPDADGWAAYEELAQAGTIGGRLWGSADGKVWFTMC